jgi:hypothetical protein
MNQQSELCSICGGDGRIANAFGSTTTCPSCHGSGRRAETTGFHDVTKTKASHHVKPVAKLAPGVVKEVWPTTPSGQLLATEVRDSPSAPDLKTRLIREIIDYEDSHGQCTQTFTKKIRKQFRR